MTVPRDTPFAEVNRNFRMKAPKMSPAEKANADAALKEFKHLLRNHGHEGAWAKIDAGIERDKQFKVKSAGDKKERQFYEMLKSGETKYFLPT